MLTCKYKFNLGSEKYEFNTVEELNSFIANNQKRIEAALKGASISFSKNADLKSETGSILEALLLDKTNLTLEINRDGDKVQKGIRDGYIGTTKFIREMKNELGNFVIKPLDVNAYKSRKVEELTQLLMQDGMEQPLANAQAVSEVNDMVASWEKIKDNGTQIHNLAEVFFQSDYPTVTDFLNDYVNLSGSNISEETVKATYDQLVALKEQIKKDHGDVDFYTEVPLYAQTEDPDHKIMGIVDLIVVDSNGVAHIYDYKTSSKKVPEWDRDKITQYVYQMAMYRQLAMQNGLNVDSVNLIPLLVDTDTASGEINSVEVQDVEALRPDLYGSKFDKIRDHVEKMLPVEYGERVFDTEGNINETYKAFFGTDMNPEIFESVKKFMDTHVQERYGKKYFMDGRRKIGLPDNIQEAEAEVINYLGRKQSNQSNIVASIKSKLKNAMRDSSYSNPLHSFNVSNTTKANNDSEINAQLAFEKYCTPNWEVVTFDELENQGIITFREKFSNVFEFLILSEDDLMNITKLKKGNTIKGNYYSNLQVRSDRFQIPADNLHMSAMKVLSFINNNIDVFANTGAKLNMIRAFSDKFNQVRGVNHEPLITAFEDLALEVGLKNNLNKLDRSTPQDILYQEVKNTLNNGDLSRVRRDQLVQLDDLLAANVNTAVLINKLQQVQKQAHSGWFNRKIDNLNMSNELDRVYFYLNATIADLSGRPAVFESEDMVKSGLANSTRFSTQDDISKETVKNALEPIKQGNNALTSAYIKLAEDMQKIFKEFYNSQGNPAAMIMLGNHALKFDNLYRRNSDNSLEGRFQFKDPDEFPNDNKYLNSAERKLLREILPKMFDYMNFDTTVTPELIEAAKNDGTYFDVPLARALTTTRFTRMFGDQEPVKEGFFERISKSVKSAADSWAISSGDLNNIFDEQRSDVLQSSADMLELYNKFDISKSREVRENYLNTKPITDFETNLEVLFGDVAYTAMRKKIFDKVLPVVHATLITSYLYNSGHTNKNVDNMHDYIKEYVKTAIFDEKLMEPNQIKTYEKLAKAKHVISMLQLGIAPFNLVRETLQGQLVNYGRLWAKQYGEDASPSIADYNKALGIMFTDTANTNYLTNITLVEELNFLYRMADIDINKLPEKMKISKVGATQVMGRWMLWFQSAPDYVTRMSFMIAKMVKDDSFKAHKIVDGEMQYNWKEDGRFSAFAKGDTTDPKYNFQRQHYLAMIDDFNKEYYATGEGTKLVEGDDLPRAYTSTERESVKSYVNWSHGSYDHGEKILFGETLIGLMFMQFKSWLVAKKRQYYTKGDKYNIGSYKHLKNNKGELMYYDAEGNKTTEADGNTPIVAWDGRYMEGVLQSIGRTWSTLRAGDLSWAEKMRELKDERITANMKMAFLDLAIPIVLGLLIKGLIDWDDLEKDNKPLAAILNTAFYATSDLNVWNNFTAAANPKAMFPTVGVMVDNLNVAYDAVFGKGSLTTILTNTTALGRAVKRSTDWLDPEED